MILLLLCLFLFKDVIAMPEITRFYGIIIKMYFISKEHSPPHFHALYGEYMSSFIIDTLDEIEGDLPYNAKNLVLKWASENQSNMRTIWDDQVFRKLQPLE